MKKIVSSAAMVGFWCAVFVFWGVQEGHRVATAQSWNAPTPPVSSSDLAGCYNSVQAGFNSSATYYQNQYNSKTATANSDERDVKLGIAIIYGGATAALPPPWSVAAAIAGAYEYWQIEQYYDNLRAQYKTNYDIQMAVLRSTADNAIIACDSEYLDGGDPENGTDEPEMDTSGTNGVDIVGGTQTIGNQGRVTGYPVN